jgi:CubicO group peptidase (beta-lactamase class C family)
MTEQRQWNASSMLLTPALAVAALTFWAYGGAPDADAPARGVALPVADTAAERVDDYLSRMVPFGWHGAVLVSRGPEVLLAKGYGTADHGEVESAPVRSWTSGTVSTVGSITKQFTAAAIMRLAQQGRLSVRDSLPVFFDDVPADKRGITLHHLLTHTSGLRAASDSLGDFDFVSRSGIVRAAMEGELASEPGSEYAYSNLGYSLLGAVVEVVTETDYERWVRDNLFRPAGMYETGYLLPGYEPERVATGYRDGERWGTVVGRLPEDTGPSWILKANGGVHSTLYDMKRWVRSLMSTDRILSPASREKLLTPYADEGYGSYYAYGWVVDTTARSTPIVQHNGGNGILAADLRWFPEDDETLAFAMSNHAEFTAIAVLDQVEALLFGGEVRMPPRVDAARVHAGRLSELAGRYRLPDGSEIEVVPLRGHLEVRVSGQPLLDRLSTAARDDRLGYADLNPRAVELGRALFEGDYATLREAEEGDSPEKPYASFRERVLEALGEFESAHALGTLPIYAGGSLGVAVTWLRLEFAEGERLIRIHWTGEGKMAAVGGSAIPAPLTLSCATIGSRECVGWDMRQPSVEPTLRFEKGGAGPPGTVTIDGGSWTLVATRVSGG